MDFNLDRDLCFIDLEATGIHVTRDRIVQIAMIKYPKTGEAPIEYNKIVNPEMPISQEAFEIHGISQSTAGEAPTFNALAKEIRDFIGDADLAGYNSNRFDIPMLLEEFGRANVKFVMGDRRLLDMQKIFFKMEPRTLRAALKFYCNETLEDAHDALADVRATVSVFKGQLERYQGQPHLSDEGKVLIEEPVRNDMQAIHEFVNPPERVDFTQRFVRNKHGDILFNFGKHKGEKAIEHPQFLRWIIDRDFPLQVKQIAMQLLEDSINQKLNAM